MKCLSCGTSLVAGKQFCHVCGARAPVECVRCGAAVDPQFRFCPDCGAEVVASAAVPAAERLVSQAGAPMPDALMQKIRAARAEVAGERKIVTVLFCDLAGSTALAEGLDPEEYHDLLDEYLAIAFREIYRFEGIVNQLAGDGFMALFGAPVAHEDAPQRALHAALAIRDALGALNARVQAERGFELQARIGIHTGPVVAGTVGNDLKMDYTAIGDTTNLAARLEALAEPGTILISQATARLVRGGFVLGPVGPLRVKGKREPVAAYEVRAAAEAGALGSVTGPALTPLVGRNAELAQLEACFQRIGEGLAQVAVIVGQAGSGKSRLLYEFRQRLADTPAVVFETRCSAWNQMVPYQPFVSMLRRHFGIEADDSPAQGCAKVQRGIQAVRANRDQTYVCLCRLLSLPTDDHHAPVGDEVKRLTFDAVRDVIAATAVNGPAVMVIEDLHWIDDPSREMLEAAVATMATAPLMLIVSHRPDFQAVWHTEAALTQLTLRRLSEAQLSEIIRNVAGGPLPEALEGMILAKAEGSPFLTEEITRSLLEEGDLVPDDGRHRVTRAVTEIRIPGTVQEVIAARLDRLPPAAKRVVQVAAVFGRQFSRAHLVEVLAPEGIDVGAALEELERRGIIHRKNLFVADEYRFGESLTQEVAYECLLLKQRRQLHERIGLLLEQSSADRSAERLALLAHHFARSDNHEKACHALLESARAAERVPAYQTAARAYHDAWAVAVGSGGRDPAPALTSLALRAAVGVGRMLTLYGVTDVAEFEPVVGQGAQLAERCGDTAVQATLRSFEGLVMMRGGRERFDQGLALVEEGLAIAKQAGLTEAVLGLSRGLAWSYLLDGRFLVARRTIEWVVSELERGGEGERLTDVYLGARWMRDLIRFHCDDLAAAAAGAEETARLAVQASNRTVQVSSAALCALLRLLGADYAAVGSWAERSLSVAQVIGNMSALVTAGAVALAAGTALGETTAPRRTLETVEQAVRDAPDLMSSLHVVIEALIAHGELAVAEQAAQQARRRAGGRFREMQSALALALVYAQYGGDRQARAEHLFAEAIATAEMLRAHTVLAAAHLGAGSLAAARGADDESQRHWRKAADVARAVGLRHYELQAARLLGADSPQAVPAAAPAALPAE